MTTKKSAGRPKGAGAITWNEPQKKQAGKLAGIGCNLNQIAAIMDVSPATLDRMIERDPSISEAISKGRESAAGNVMNTAYNMAISGKVPALTIFWLKTRQRWAEPKPFDDIENDEKLTDFTLNYKE